MEPLILLIDTCTEVCSVALSRGTEVLGQVSTTQHHAHAAQLVPLVQGLLQEQHVALTDCHAVAVSRGPGSYTGLRVGASTAKGLCYGAGKPLLSVSSLEMLVHGFLSKKPAEDYAYIVPMIDARRMEVYTLVYDTATQSMGPTTAQVITPQHYQDLLARGPVAFIGNGALKCQEVIVHPQARFFAEPALASGMACPAAEAYRRGAFEDVAYFTPAYLKDFVVTPSKKKLI